MEHGIRFVKYLAAAFVLFWVPGFLFVGAAGAGTALQGIGWLVTGMSLGLALIVACLLVAADAVGEMNRKKQNKAYKKAYM